MLDAISETHSWFIFHLRTSDTTITNKLDLSTIERQVNAMNLVPLAKNPAVLYTNVKTYPDFVAKYKAVVSLWDPDAKVACEALFKERPWSSYNVKLGKTSVFLTEPAWRALEDKLRIIEAEEEERLAAIKLAEGGSPVASDSNSPSKRFMSGNMTDDGSVYGSDAGSHYDSEFEYSPKTSRNNTIGGLPEMMEVGSASPKDKPPAKPPTKAISSTRKCWLCFTWSTTWCCLPPFLSLCGKMRQRDRQIAWREKVALCIIIFFMNAVILFFIIGLGYVLCPKRNQMSTGQVSALYNVGPKAAVYMYGSYYYINNIVTDHLNQGFAANNQDNTVPAWQNLVLGHDVTQMFDRGGSGSDVWNNYCPTFMQPAGFRVSNPLPSHTAYYPHTRLTEFTKVQSLIQGDIVWEPSVLASNAQENQRHYLVVKDRVYDVSAFYDANINPSATNTIGFGTGNSLYFFPDAFYNITELRSSTAPFDATNLFRQFQAQDKQLYARTMNCMNNLFYIGMIDHRADLQCVIPNYVLLAASAILVAVIGFKFLAALQFPGKREPEDHDKFVICQVPCYTEGEVSLRRTIDSLSNLNYDDKHKLLFIICDGMVIGSGNDRPTPRIVLDILGISPDEEPENFPFQSLGEGNAQLNMGKIYSGLYQINGHVVPFIVVVKVGKSSERGKPGNRGKRDSQLILMRFLSRVHFNQAMNPMELELYHQMKKIIGVDPSFYEYVFMVDADTQVHTDSLNLLVSHMTRDGRISGTCGETNIANERKSFTSMIQVYEYFISHHMAKAFESLFGSVTCLPGCFCIYRVRTPTKNVPVLVAPGVIDDYSENDVDTLHLKNLLHLGEDRYLTTLIMKHFPNMKTTFTPDAKCQTYAPERWSVLLSQRRRWINSTVHNLFELLRLSELCGFCCFSMRFVVFVDLLATFIQPSALLYIGYLIYTSVTSTDTTNFPLISIIMIGAVYGFQVIIFLLRTEWQHIGWMIIYLIASPLFSFYIPLYSFWHFDDFSWGNTRTVVDQGKQVEKPVNEVEHFDPSSVPLQKWSDYEARRSSDKGDIQSVGSRQSGKTLEDGNNNYRMSMQSEGYFANGAASMFGGNRNSMLMFGADKRMSMQSGVQIDYTTAYPAPPPNYDTSNVPGSRRPLSVAISQRPNAVDSFPTDEEILREIRHILSTTDLMKVTKKSVREQLSQYFGVDLSSEKEFIHRSIDAILRGDL